MKWAPLSLKRQERGGHTQNVKVEGSTKRDDMQIPWRDAPAVCYSRR